MKKKKCEEQFSLSEKTYYRLRKFIEECKNQVKINSRETEIERIVRNILQDLGVDFKREKYVSSGRWRVDFIINNTCIEVQGDYWHGNPRLYNENELNKVQLRNRANDILKKEWLLNNNYKLLELWEMDIYDNLDNIKQIIKKKLTWLKKQ